MMTKVKSPKEIEAMRESGRILGAVLKLIREQVQPGHTGKDMARLARQELKAMGAKPAFFGYPGPPGVISFPDVICISVNDEVVHGIPNDTEFKAGDLVGFDFGVDYRGMITDAAISVLIGNTGTPAAKRLLAATEASLEAGIAVMKGGMQVGDISEAVQNVLDSEKLGIVRDLVGHGVGHEVHEGPDIANYGKAGTGPVLQAGMTVAVEPMATLGGYDVDIDQDGWTIRTLDRSLSAHFEHTILLTEAGHEVLTA